METKRVTLIVPTLNEAENIVSLITAYHEVHERLMIIVADSDSPDGTARLVHETFTDEAKVRVLPCRREQGRGAAIAEAYQWILAHDVPDVIATSDADFSHDPKELPRLLAALEGADVVIGSRYLPASEIIGWPWHRYWFSKAANWLARRTLRLGIRDYTNGYRVFTADALRLLAVDKLDADGFIMLSQELVQWRQQGLRVTEVPTRFVNRVRGPSKFSLALVFEAWRVLWRLVGWSRQLNDVARQDTKGRS